ncbi:hypothetical protein [Halalkalibacter flavus]|uniref:hypothetical protein n=1 Tax=Halalkalibacter flavus TaxID=3090668 RepID=UPI002FC86F76
MKLPKKYHEIHNYCLILHDHLVLTVDEIEKNDLHNVKINFKDEKEWEEFNQSEDTIEAMKDFGYVEEYKTLALRQLTIATLAEFLHFIYEALKTSEKGKLSVTYTLLRKPFKEILLLWEWIIVDSDSFFEAYENDSKKFDLTQWELRQKIKKQLGDVGFESDMLELDLICVLLKTRYMVLKAYGINRFIWLQRKSTIRLNH